MSITRRDWSLTGQAGLLDFAMSWPGVATPREPARLNQQRIEHIIRSYEEQGLHRTGTETDRRSGDWLMAQARQTGLKPMREEFALSRVDPVAASLLVSGRQVEGVPLFDCRFTSAEGIRGRLGALNSDAPVGLAEIAPNAAEVGLLGDARRQNRHRAIVIVTRGGRPGLCPSNAESFLHPFGPPCLQVSSEEASFLNECVQQGGEVVLIAHVKRTPADAFNVTAAIEGSDKALSALIIMTPRSGWWTCASERGGGLACCLELMRAMRKMRPARDVLFVA